MDNENIIRNIGIAIILLVSLISFMVGISVANAASNSNNDNLNNQKLDIRFIIDMSFEMKDMDPNKSRIRTLQKIVKSLPNDARSGIWTYGKYVNMLVPLGTTDDKWKKQAIYKIDKIHGYGNYRNLSGAVASAIHGWQDEQDYKKYLIVLTSGGLHISETKTKNNFARTQLLTRTLPKLVKAGIQLHTVSLSDQADNRLLKILSKQTNGKWYSVNNIHNLESVIQHVYNQVTKDLVSFNKNVPVVKVAKETKSNIKTATEILTEPSTDSTDTAEIIPIASSMSKNNSTVQIKNQNNSEINYSTHIITNVSSTNDSNDTDEWVTLYSG